MDKISIGCFNKIHLNTFRPICYTRFGEEAVDRFGIPPFVDCSCRREPDLENPRPGITAICRGGLFAPQLKLNDVIIYKTIGGRYGRYFRGHHLVAVLKVTAIFNTHEDAAKAYQAGGLPIPGNCMVDGNGPEPFDKTAGDFMNARDINLYRAAYDAESSKHPSPQSEDGNIIINHVSARTVCIFRPSRCMWIW